MINRRVSLFYRYPLKDFLHMVCPCTLDGVCVVCPDTSELVGQQVSSCIENIIQALPMMIDLGIVMVALRFYGVTYRDGRADYGIYQTWCGDYSMGVPWSVICVPWSYHIFKRIN